MARPVDRTRRTELLDAAVDHVINSGLTELSWRPLADGLGVSTTTLIHHFGTKDQMIAIVLNRMRERILAATTGSDPTDDGLRAAAQRVWQWSASPAHEPMFRTFFAAYGLALQHPDRFEDFLAHIVADWQRFFSRHKHGQAEQRQITIVIAVIRGLLLDLLATGDRHRVDRAFSDFLDTSPNRSSK